MGNASDTSAEFASRIPKEYDIFMGSLYSVFCKSTQHANLYYMDHLLWGQIPRGERCVAIHFNPFFFYRYTVCHGQLHSATCCISQAVDLEASGVLHHQSLYQWPWDDTVFIPTGNTISFFAQVPELLLFFTLPTSASNWSLTLTKSLLLATNDSSTVSGVCFLIYM